MLQPVTVIAREFSVHCAALNDALSETELSRPGVGKQDRISKAIQVFFDGIRNLASKIAADPARATVLFEIDCALTGVYGSTVFVRQDKNPVRLLLRDLTALWQRYHLIASLERTALANGGLRTTMSFYDSWVKQENIGVQQSEYDRLLSDVSLMLKSSDNLSLSGKVTLFSLMGEILTTLGVSEDFARDRLGAYLDVLRARKYDSSETTLPEIVLCLQVLKASGQSLQGTGVDDTTINRTIRLLSSKDEFLDHLFKTWGWHWNYDLSTPLVKGDQLKIKEQSSLFSMYVNGTAELGVGHSFLEMEEHKLKNPGFTNVFQPIPIFMFGHSGVGKSSLLMAYCYDVQMRGGRSIALGREIKAFYDANAGPWRSGSMSPSKGLQSFSFWEDLSVASFETFDYGGKETQPDQWEPKLQDIFRTAKGLFFLIDAQEFREPDRLRSKANWFDAILQYWMQSNPQIHHVPVGVVVTKCDLILGEGIRQLEHSSLVPPSLQPGLVDVFLPHRFPNTRGELSTPVDRFRNFIIHEKLNNVHPAVQDVAETLLDTCSQFFGRVLRLTYNYQIFLTSSLPPQTPNDAVFPWKVADPFQWMMHTLDGFHIRESIVKMRSEERQVEDEVRIMREDVNRMRSKLNDIEHQDAERKHILQRSPVFHVMMKEKLKFLEDNIHQAEQEFMAIAQRYAKDANLQNKTQAMQLVEREIKKREGVYNAIREKRVDFEKRLNANHLAGLRS